MSFKDSSYLELWQHFCSAEQNHLRNFGRGYYEEQFCEIILNFNHWFLRCRLKKFLSGALEALLFSTAEPFVQLLFFFGRGYEEQFCEIILKLDQWLRP